MTDLVAMTNLTEQTVRRTLSKLAAAGIVRFDEGKGRQWRPTLAARRVFFEVDLLSATQRSAAYSTVTLFAKLRG